MKSTDWKEFDGIRSERVSKRTGFVFILVYRRTGGDTVDLYTAFSHTVSTDGWDNGRNEQYTHWMPIALPN